MNNRISSLDIAKGIGIFLVVLGHTTKIIEIKEYIWNFHMPLFFFISGILFRPRETIKSHLRHRSKSILVPYLLFYVLTYTYWLLIERHFRGDDLSIFGQLFGLIYGTYGEYCVFNDALWFLPCLFIVDILYTTIYFSGKHTAIHHVAILLFCFCCGTLLRDNHITWLPFGISYSFFALIFFVLGRMCYSMLAEKNFSSKTSVLIIICCLIIQSMNVGKYSRNLFTMDLYYIPIAFIGIMLCMTISLLIKKNSLIEYWGKNSIVIYGLHVPLYRIVWFLISRLTGTDIDTMRQSWIWSITTTLITLIIFIPIIYLRNKKMLWIKR